MGFSQEELDALREELGDEIEGLNEEEIEELIIARSNENECCCCCCSVILLILLVKIAHLIAIKLNLQQHGKQT